GVGPAPRPGPGPARRRVLRSASRPEPACRPPSPPASGFAPRAPFAPPAGPSVEQIRENPPSVMPPSTGTENIPPTTLPYPPGTSYPRTTPNSNPKIRPEKTVSRSTTVMVRGEVVMPDQITPRPGAKLVFMSAEKPDEKRYVTANEFGEFDTQLPAGEWYLYVGGGDGKATFHKKVSLGEKDAYDYKVVSR